MQKLFAFILFYLMIGCLSTSVYAEMYMWTDEKGIKHFSNTALNEQGKDIKKEGEIKFDEAKYQEILEQQKARIQAEADQNKASLYVEQARIQSKADQNKASFREEYERELRKKFVHDAVYGYPLPPLEDPPRQSPMTKWEMKKTVEDAVEDAVREGIKNDRLMHFRPYKSKY